MTAFLFAMTGWMLLVMGMSQHQRKLFGYILARNSTFFLRSAGSLMLLLALVLLAKPINTALSTSVAMWLMLLTPSAVGAALLLTYVSADTFKRIAFCCSGLASLGLILL